MMRNAQTFTRSNISKIEQDVMRTRVSCYKKRNFNNHYIASIMGISDGMVRKIIEEGE